MKLHSKENTHTLKNNVRKVVNIGIMGLLLGSVVIPTTILAAEVTTPNPATGNVTNPGNIVSDDNTYYDTFEWYGSTGLAVESGLESGHYTKSLNRSANYSFEVKNDTDKAVDFLPAADFLGAADDVYVPSGIGSKGGNPTWFTNSGTVGLDAWQVGAHSTRTVTAPCTTRQNAVLKGFYLYVFGLNKGESTEGLSYRIYQGNSKPAVVNKTLMPYWIGLPDWMVPGEPHRNYVKTTKDQSKGLLLENTELTILLNNENATKDLLTGGDSEAARPIITRRWNDTLQYAATNGTSVNGNPMISFMNVNEEYTNSSDVETMIGRFGDNAGLLRIKLNNISVPVGTRYLTFTFQAKYGVLLNDITLKIPLEWK
ncbi:MAG: hypothetical protein LBT37_01215 [Lactobacillaceae bacterium]|jgi:hypothetical protein|nr:hypothetical protein [Lactobacillaceae bacterium]